MQEEQPTLERIVEGRTQLDVPAQSLIKREPDMYPIFFNPAARINRDISVALVKVLGGSSFCDVMAGLGARGIRVANESSGRIEVTLNDFNRGATQLARTNVRTNGLLGRIELCEKDANVLLFMSRRRADAYDHIDIDPFGTPAPYVQGGFSASREGTVISATATDTPVLCGVHPRVSLRRYGSISRRNEFKHETGIRILLRYLAIVAAAQDVGIEPVIVHSTRHYLRVFVRARHGAARADESLEKSGYVSSCAGCGRRELGKVVPPRGCPSCGFAEVLTAGPVWTGPLTDEKVVAAAARACSGMGFMHAERLLLSLIGVDDFPPYGFDLEEVCSRLRIPSVSRERVIEALERSGHASMKQPLESSGIKTAAEYGEIVEAVRSVAVGETARRPLPGAIGRRGGGGRYY